MQVECDARARLSFAQRGIVQTRALRSISHHLAPSTSLVRFTLRMQNSRARAVTASRVRSSAASAGTSG